MSAKTRKLLLIIIGLFLIAVAYHPYIYMLIWPDCSYESSDGKWHDRELQLKGRGFDDIVALFELYKLRCDAPTVNLVRTTRKIPLNIFAWHNYLRDEKWKIEYGVPSSKKQRSADMPVHGDAVAGEPPCYNTLKVDRDRDFKMAFEARGKFIERLSSVKQPPLFEK
jgi:hypothetical protein